MSAPCTNRDTLESMHELPRATCNAPAPELDCRDVAAGLCAYLDGDLEAEIARSIEEHLKLCWQCRWVASAARHTLQQIG